MSSKDYLRARKAKRYIGYTCRGGCPMQQVQPTAPAAVPVNHPEDDLPGSEEGVYAQLQPATPEEEEIGEEVIQESEDELDAFLGSAAMASHEPTEDPQTSAEDSFDFDWPFDTPQPTQNA